MKKPSKFEEWFRTFLEEKDLPVYTFWITDHNKEVHIIDNYDVAELIINNCDKATQESVKVQLIKFDFMNSGAHHINAFFEYVGIGYFDRTKHANGGK